MVGLFICFCIFFVFNETSPNLSKKKNRLFYSTKRSQDSACCFPPLVSGVNSDVKRRITPCPMILQVPVLRAEGSPAVPGLRDVAHSHLRAVVLRFCACEELPEEGGRELLDNQRVLWEIGGFPRAPLLQHGRETVPALLREVPLLQEVSERDLDRSDEDQVKPICFWNIPGIFSCLWCFSLSQVHH